MPAPLPDHRDRVNAYLDTLWAARADGRWSALTAILAALHHQERGATIRALSEPLARACDHARKPATVVYLTERARRAMGEMLF